MKFDFDFFLLTDVRIQFWFSFYLSMMLFHYSSSISTAIKSENLTYSGRPLLVSPFDFENFPSS